MIKAVSTGDSSVEMIGSSLLPSVGGRALPSSSVTEDDVRLRQIIDQQADFVWRVLRRLGLPADVAEDAAQRVFLVVSQRIAQIAPGAEQAFLFRTAVHVAARTRRSIQRRREELTDDPAARLADGAPGAEELVDRKYAAELLEQALAGMELDARAVFILFELEGKGTAEIASMLDLPMGTVASRLRRARADFEAFVKRAQARSRRSSR